MAVRNDFSAATKAELSAFNSAQDTQGCMVLGDTTLGDNGIRFYYYDAASSASADGENVLTATGMGGTGRWVKETEFATIKKDYVNSVAVAGGAGVATFYLTSDKTSSGTALYSNIDSVLPIVNDAANNYTYGWAVSMDKKTLTVTTKLTSGVTVLGISVLAAPTNAANGTIVCAMVKGS
jgi:hypothetical protein